MKNRIENIIHIKDNSDLQNLIIRQPFIYFKGNKILLLNSGYWKNKKSFKKMLTRGWVDDKIKKSLGCDRVNGL